MKNYWLENRTPEISLIERKDKKIIIHFKSGSAYEFWEAVYFRYGFFGQTINFVMNSDREWNIARVTSMYIFSILPSIRVKEKSYYIDSIADSLRVKPLKLQTRCMIFDAVKLHSPRIRKNNDKLDDLEQKI